MSRPFLRVAIVVSVLASLASAGGKIALSPAQVYNIAGQGDARLLVDEQAAVGDPRAARSGSASTLFTPGYIKKELHYPARAVIDLGVATQVEAAYWYDVNNADSLWLSCWESGTWTRVASRHLGKYNSWDSAAVSCHTRYFMVTLAGPASLLAEVVLYGTPDAASPPAASEEPLAYPAVDSIFGVNGFVDDPWDRLSVATSLREYHNWRWDEGDGSNPYSGFPDNQCAWSPSWVSGTGWGWNFDDFYAQANRHGVDPMPVFQGNALYMTGYAADSSENKPVREASRPTEDPASYVEHAAYLFQFAARYGSTRVADSLLRLRPGQPRSTGLGLVRSMEDWNEPNKDWRGRSGYFNPWELAAMASADADGHRGTLGRRIGARTADPAMRMVMPGLIELDTPYVAAMKLWSDLHRGGDFPYAVLNFHHYSSDAGGQSGNPTTGISPEADSLREKLERVARWKNRHLPGRKVWLSEFGYDANQDSRLRAARTPLTDSQEIQARWLVRSVLAIAASGIDRAHIFMLRDEWGPSPGNFASSGLTSEKGSWKPKKSWYALRATRRILAGTRFDREIASGNPLVRIYAFRGIEDPARQVYALWCPTAADKAVSGYALAVPAGDSFALAALPSGATASDTLETRSPLAAAASQVRVDVSERPVFVSFRDGASTIARLAVARRLSVRSAHGSIRLESHGDAIVSVRATRLDGRVVALWSGSAARVALPHPTSGLLALEVRTASGTTVRRVLPAL